MFNNIRLEINNYKINLPHDIAKSAFKTAVYSSAISILWTGGNIQVACVVGAAAGMASVIHSLTIPLFCRLTNQNPRHVISWFNDTLLRVASLAVTQSITLITPYRINLFAHIFFTVFLNIFITPIQTHLIASPYIIV